MKMAKDEKLRRLLKLKLHKSCQQNEAISGTLNEGCKMVKLNMGYKDIAGVKSRQQTNTVVKLPL